MSPVDPPQHKSVLFFMANRSSGGFHLVTAFADVGHMPQPSLMADVDSTLHYIPQWKLLVVRTS